jgi:hypothetical protein
MNISSLKQALLGAVVLGSIAGATLGATREDIKRVDAQAEQILETCLFDQNDKHPLHYFIDQLIAVILNNKEVVKQKLQGSGITNIDQYIEKFVQKLQQIKFSKDIEEIKRILKPYLKKNARILPQGIQQKNQLLILKGLKFRLSLNNRAAHDA